MNRRVIALAVLLAAIFSLAIPTTEVGASEQVVIAQVQAGASSAATQEYISIYNQSDVPIDVTGWCLLYNTSTTKPGCIEASDTYTKVWLLPHSFATFASLDFIAAHQGFKPNASPAFVAGLSDSSGELTLLNSQKQVVDRMNWSKKADIGMIYQRMDIIVPEGEQPINNDMSEWGQTWLVLPPANGIEEIPVYVCPNVGPRLTAVPEGYIEDEEGNCFMDTCLNLPGLQKEAPIGYWQDEKKGCWLDVPNLQITEVLPNASGVDTGKEFIEIYNPTDTEAQLKQYRISMGMHNEKTYQFPVGAVIAPYSYKAFSDTNLGLVLPNTTTRLQLSSSDGQLFSEMQSYENPKDDIAWALIGGLWQWTNRPTPNQPNLSWYEMEAGKGGASVKEPTPCRDDQYRNPDTNRCRLIESATSSPTPCKEGQERNPVTNRCRNVAGVASTLKPCDPGQERNPETNRCRKVGASSSVLKPCAANQERSPETNRCRKKSTQKLAQEVKDVQSPLLANRTGWLMAGGALTVAGGYGVWEWRSEIRNGLRRLRLFFGKNPSPD